MLRRNLSIQSAARIQPRRGRLAGLLRGLIIVSVLIGVGVIALSWALYPWIHLVGSKYRILPFWSGVGVANTPSGRYRIYVSFYAVNNRSQMYPGVQVRGNGYICAPNGQRYLAHVSGGTYGRIWSKMDDHPFSLLVYHRPIAYWQFSSYSDWRPSLSFHGAWSGPNLQMTDDGSIHNAFLPDGSLNAHAPKWHPKTDAVPVTFVETGWLLPEDCPRDGN